MTDSAAGGAAGPDQFKRREQPPSVIAPQDTLRDQTPGNRRRIQALTAEAASNPKSLSQRSDLRHAVHGLAHSAAPDLRDLDLAEPWEDRADPACNGPGKSLWPRVPSGFRTGPHQAVAIHDSEMIDAVGVGDRALEHDDLGQAIAKRRGNGTVAPNRQQRLRQPPQRRAKMDVAGQYDMRRAQSRRWSHDAPANAGWIDAD